MAMEVKCRRCGLPHPVDTYRRVRFYICTLFNRVLLLNDEETNDQETRTDTDRTDSIDP